MVFVVATLLMSSVAPAARKMARLAVLLVNEASVLLMANFTVPSSMRRPPVNVLLALSMSVPGPVLMSCVRLVLVV